LNINHYKGCEEKEYALDAFTEKPPPAEKGQSSENAEYGLGAAHRERFCFRLRRERP